MSTDFYSPVKQLVRTISDTPSAQTVDYELGDWYSMGYRLFSTHNLVSAPTGITILYVLVKDAP